MSNSCKGGALSSGLLPLDASPPLYSVFIFFAIELCKLFYDGNK